MGFLSVPNLVPWCNFQSLNRHWSVLLDQIPLQLDRKGIKESEDGKRGGEGGDYFKYFHQRGAIIQERRLLEGWLLFKEMRCFKIKHHVQCLLFLMLINVSFFLKSDTNHSTFPFSVPCPMFSLNVGHKLKGFILVRQTLLSETRFPYNLENKPFVFVSTLSYV